MVAQPGVAARMGGGIGSVENSGHRLAKQKLKQKQQEQQKQQEKWGTSAVYPGTVYSMKNFFLPKEMRQKRPRTKRAAVVPVPVPVVVPPLPKEMDRPVKKQVVGKEEK